MWGCVFSHGRAAGVGVAHPARVRAGGVHTPVLRRYACCVGTRRVRAGGCRRTWRPQGAAAPTRAAPGGTNARGWRHVRPPPRAPGAAGGGIHHRCRCSRPRRGGDGVGVGARSGWRVHAPNVFSTHSRARPRTTTPTAAPHHHPTLGATATPTAQNTAPQASTPRPQAPNPSPHHTATPRHRHQTQALTAPPTHRRRHARPHHTTPPRRRRQPPSPHRPPPASLTPPPANARCPPPPPAPAPPPP